RRREQWERGSGRKRTRHEWARSHSSLQLLLPSVRWLSALSVLPGSFSLPSLLCSALARCQEPDHSRRGTVSADKPTRTRSDVPSRSASRLVSSRVVSSRVSLVPPTVDP